MSKRFLAAAAVLLIAAAVWWSWRLRQQPRPPTAAQASETGAVPEADRTPTDPDLALSIDDATHVQVFAGWPLLADVSVMQPQAFASTPVIAPVVALAPAGWEAALRVEVRTAAGTIVHWSFHRARTAVSPARLEGNRTAEFTWWIDPSDASHFAPGRYEVQVVLNVSANSSSSVWHGTARSQPVAVQVETLPLTLTPGQIEEHSLLQARYEYARGDAAAALRTIDGVLAQHPASIAALTSQAALLRETGQTRQALDVVDHALSVFYASNVRPTEPPRELLRARSELRAALATQAR